MSRRFSKSAQGVLFRRVRNWIVVIDGKEWRVKVTAAPKAVVAQVNYSSREIVIRDTGERDMVTGLILAVNLIDRRKPRKAIYPFPASDLTPVPLRMFGRGGG